jgi:Helix-turn-helix domain
MTITTSDARTNVTGVPSRRLLIESEAAAHLRVSRSFLAKKRCSGGGPRFCKIGRRVLYDIADLEEFAERGKRRSTSELVF